jgi:hypothetical protein
MPTLFDHDYSPAQLKAMTGSLAQIAGIRLFEYADGKARGMRAAEVFTGSGFRFHVLLDRACDIGMTEYGGKPLAWLHPALGTSAQYEPVGLGWERTFGGGLVTTCGLTHFGQPELDGPESFGLHGRISHIPAERINLTEEWRGQDFVLELEGQVRQSVLSGENLLLVRKISTRLGANHLLIEDVVRNEGGRPTPHMILYHCNFGFPVVSPDSELVIDDIAVSPRDEAARGGLDRYTRFELPKADFSEQVFFHKPRTDANGYAQATIFNRALNYGAYVKYRSIELPYLGQWKQMGVGEYVCALEPANRWETPRHRLRAEARMPILAPGEEVHYRLEIGALVGAEALWAFNPHA